MYLKEDRKNRYLIIKNNDSFYEFFSNTFLNYEKELLNNLNIFIAPIDILLKYYKKLSYINNSNVIIKKKF